MSQATTPVNIAMTIRRMQTLSTAHSIVRQVDTIVDNDSNVKLLRMVIRPLDGDLLDWEVSSLVRDASRLKWVDDSAFALAGGSAGALNLQAAEVSAIEPLAVLRVSSGRKPSCPTGDYDHTYFHLLHLLPPARCSPTALSVRTRAGETSIRYIRNIRDTQVALALADLSLSLFDHPLLSRQHARERLHKADVQPSKSPSNKFHP